MHIDPIIMLIDTCDHGVADADHAHLFTKTCVLFRHHWNGRLAALEVQWPYTYASLSDWNLQR